MRAKVSPPRLVTSVALAVAMMAGLSGCGGSAQPTGAIRPTAAEASRLVYVALGDSYTAAPLVGTEVMRACRRTSSNYPQLVASSLRTAQARDVTLLDASCGGARVADLWSRQKPTVPPQLSAVSSEASIVTVAFGGNDVGIMPLVTGCLTTPSVCANRARRVNAGQARLKRDLVAALKRIKKRAPRAQLLVVGYPEIVPSSGRCLKAGRKAVRTAREALNRIAVTQRAAARQVGVRFVDLRTVTRGHGLCTRDPWIAARTSNEALRFHPTAAEQDAAARAIARVLQARL